MPPAPVALFHDAQASRYTVRVTVGDETAEYGYLAYWVLRERGRLVCAGCGGYDCRHVELVRKYEAGG